MSGEVNRRLLTQGTGDKAARRLSSSSLRLLAMVETALQAACAFFGVCSQPAKTGKSGGAQPEHAFVIHP